MSYPNGTTVVYRTSEASFFNWYLKFFLFSEVNKDDALRSFVLYVFSRDARVI